MQIGDPVPFDIARDAASAPFGVTLSLSKGASASGLTAQSLAAALVFREVLKPLAQGLGPVGELAVDGVVDALFLRDLR